MTPQAAEKKYSRWIKQVSNTCIESNANFRALTFDVHLGLVFVLEDIALSSILSAAVACCS